MTDEQLIYLEETLERSQFVEFLVDNLDKGVITYLQYKSFMEVQHDYRE